MRKHALLPAMLFVAIAMQAMVRANWPADNTRTKRKKVAVTKQVQSASVDTVMRNIALSKEIDVSASAFVNQSETPEMACDGNGQTKWCDNSSPNKWLLYDLQKDYNVRKVCLIWENWDPNNIYKVQTSVDGHHWTDRITETTNTQNQRVYDVDWKGVRLVRFLARRGQRRRCALDGVPGVD